MSHFVNAVRAAAAASLVGGLACLGPQTATAAPNTGDPADVNKLAGMLSKGYTLSDCPPQPVSPGVLAYLKCGQNPDASVIGSAGYMLTDNDSDLSLLFHGALSALTLDACSPGEPSPNTWNYTSSGTTAGDLACGTLKNSDTKQLIWTSYKNQMAGILGRIRHRHALSVVGEKRLTFTQTALVTEPRRRDGQCPC